MDTFEDWLDSVPSLALRELAGGETYLRSLPVEQVRDLVRTQPALLARAKESWNIMNAARESVAAMDPWVLRDRKMHFGLVD